MLILWVWAVLGSAFAATEAERLMWAGRLEQALPVARREAEAAPGDIDAQERYIDLLSTLGLATTGTVVYRARLESNPDSADAAYLLGRALPDPSLAEEAYRLGLALDASHARSQLGLAAVDASRGRFVEAEAAYGESVRRDPSLVEGWSGLARTRIMLGKPEEALAAARSAVRNVPGAADGYLVLAVLAPAEAENVLAEAARRVPEDPRVHAARAEDFLSRGQGEPALKAANTALSLDPSHGGAALSALLAHALIERRLDREGYQQLMRWKAKEGKDRSGAETAYAALAARYPRSALPRLAQARVAMASGQRDAALRHLRSALEVEPESVEVRATLGVQLRAAGQLSAARPLLEAAVAARPLDVSLILALAVSEAATGDWARAVTRLEDAEKRWPHEARLPLELAGLYADSGKNEDAFRVLATAVTRVPDVRLAVSLVAAAVATKRLEEGARLAEDVARRTGDAKWRDIASKLRSAQGPAK